MNQVTYLKQSEGETIQELAKRIAEAHEDMRQKQPEIISRAEAKARGLKYYFTGEPCKNGGIGKRRVSSCICVCENCYASHKEKEKDRYHQNKEKIKNRIRSYYYENRDEILLKARKRSKIYYDKNRDSINDKQKKRRRENIEIYLYKNMEYRRANKEKIKERNSLWEKNNRDKCNAIKAKRRAAKRQAIPSWFSEFDEFAFQQAYELAVERKIETGIEWHIDHIIPLLARKCCGLHCAANIQVIPKAMNLAKGNKMIFTEPLEWLR